MTIHQLRRNFALLALVLLTCAFTTACGGSGSPTAPSTTPPVTPAANAVAFISAVPGTGQKVSDHVNIQASYALTGMEPGVGYIVEATLSEDGVNPISGTHGSAGIANNGMELAGTVDINLDIFTDSYHSSQFILLTVKNLKTFQAIVSTAQPWALSR